MSQAALGRMDDAGRHGACLFFCVNIIMGRDKSNRVRVDPLEFEQECETWDWARTAGVSAQDLRKALRDSLAAQAPEYRLAA
jgi:hypothetical protein